MPLIVTSYQKDEVLDKIELIDLLFEEYVNKND